MTQERGGWTWSWDLTAFRRLTGPRPGGTDRERGDHENTLPLVGRVLGQVQLYGERGRREGGQTETSTKMIEGYQERERYF